MAEITEAPNPNINKCVRFDTDGITPPSMLYLTRDDSIFVRIWNSATGADVEVRGRLMLPSGRVVPFVQHFVPTTARALNTFTFSLAEGYLLDMCATPIAGSPKRGQCFVQVGIRRGETGNFEPTALLISDYVTTAAQVGWPSGQLRSSLDGPGFVRSVTGTDPAANANWSETVPANARWALRSVIASFVTDANVANRFPTFVIDDGTTQTFAALMQTAQGAGATKEYVWSNSPAVGSFALTSVPIPIVTVPVMLAGWRVRVTTLNLQVGDNWGAPQMYLEEWIET